MTPDGPDVSPQQRAHAAAEGVYGAHASTLPSLCYGVLAEIAASSAVIGLKDSDVAAERTKVCFNQGMKHSHHHREAPNPREQQLRSSPREAPAKAYSRTLRDAMTTGHANDDAAFDQFIPLEDRRVSLEYWTPLHVAAHVSAWLDHFGARSVVDVGSGVGKFCVAAALTGSCHFIGIEHRERLVTAARELARTFEVEDRVDFFRSSVGPGNWPKADAYYLFNPFAENLCQREDQLDSDVELGLERYKKEIAAAEQFIEHAPRGTYVITYNGFGGRVPDSYKQLAIDRDLPYELRMWRKERQTSNGRVWRSG